MATEIVKKLIETLSQALREHDRRKQLIKEFQQRVWDASPNPSERWEWAILGDLAYDLDFYEPDPDARAEDASFYGDERVEKEIRLALEKLVNQAESESPTPSE
jgi:hypothetical protein